MTKQTQPPQASEVEAVEKAMQAVVDDPTITLSRQFHREWEAMRVRLAKAAIAALQPSATACTVCNRPGHAWCGNEASYVLDTKAGVQPSGAGEWREIAGITKFPQDRVLCVSFDETGADYEVCGVPEYALMHGFTHFMPLPLPPTSKSKEVV